MSTTTQILFNSPALHSLKRDQLVKLCKIHSLKASGKNKELIERLQLHAKTLPLDDPLSIATRSDHPDAKPVLDSEDEASDQPAPAHASVSINIARPSEQWDVVMDAITEVDEETLRSNRGGSDRLVSEFGTNTSKASVGSSLRAIATSLGLKRSTFKSDGTTSTSTSSSLSSKGVIQSSSTLPTSDPNGGFEEPSMEPVPGQSNLQGFPAPSGARLSLSQAPTTTTIRLVSNPTTLLLSPPKLKPFATSFDLVPGTPGGAVNSPVLVWPPSPGDAARGSLYPSIPTFEDSCDMNQHQSTQSVRYDNSDMDIDMDMPGGLAVCELPLPKPRASARLNTGATPKSTEKPSAEPTDIFSPAPKPQNTFTRSKLGIPRSEPFVFGSPFPQHNMSNLQFRTAAQSVLEDMNKRLAEEGVEAVNADVLNKHQTTTEEAVGQQGSGGRARAGDMFDKIHQKEFGKMDSITSHYAAKRGAQSAVAQPIPILSKKRKSSLVVKERKQGVPTARHRPNGSRAASGASVKILPGELCEDDEVDEVADRRASKRPRVEPGGSDTPAQPEKPPLAELPGPEEEARKQKEREAIRRRLEHSKAKRRSSMGRPSVGRAPPKPARFGFFASAKSLVQSVWNRGAGSKAPSNMPVTKPTQPKMETRTLSKTTGTKKATMTFSVFSSGGGSKPLQTNGSGRSDLAPPVTSGTAASSPAKSSMSRLNPPSSSAAANPRSSTIAGFGQPNNKGGHAKFSSLGMKTGLSAVNAGTSSLGAKPNTRPSGANHEKQTTPIVRSRTMSTLMAPTASSLAKMNSHSRIPVAVASHDENATLAKANTTWKQRLATSPQPGGGTLEQVTNSPRSPAHVGRPASKIFSVPLSPPRTGPPMSLTTAAASIAGRAPHASSPTSPKKPSAGPKSKVLAGRRPRVSRSKVIARLASQRAAGSGLASGSRAHAGTGAGQAGGRVRSSVGAQVAGRTRGSYAGTKGTDIAMMNAKKRVRQSEHVRRRSRAIASERLRIGATD